MPLFGKRAERRPFLLPFGVTLGGCRGGGVAEGMREGHTIKHLKNSPYKYQITAIVSRDRIFPLFTSLKSFVGLPSMAVMENHLDEPMKVYESTTCTVDDAFKAFSEHSFQLVNDGFTAFGLASESFEVFIGQHKDLTIYCRSSKEVVDTLKEYEIPHETDLTWIGKYPHYHFQIGALFGAEEIRKMCEAPPEEEVRRYRLNPGTYNAFFTTIINGLHMRVCTDPQHH